MICQNTVVLPARSGGDHRSAEHPGCLPSTDDAQVYAGTVICAPIVPGGPLCFRSYSVAFRV